MYKSIQSTVYISDTESTRYSFLQFALKFFWTRSLKKKKLLQLKTLILHLWLNNSKQLLNIYFAASAKNPKINKSTKHVTKELKTVGR